jgi:hypothetical protein
LPEIQDVNFGCDFDEKQKLEEVKYSSTSGKKNKSLIISKNNSEEDKRNLNDSMIALDQETMLFTERTQSNMTAVE